MKRATPILRFIVLLCTFCALSVAAHAQVRYAFVSMTGSDANNCWSATTACRTFQRAHDVVSDGGTVAALDSGGYGPLNITKSVTVTGKGVEAGLTATGITIGVNINAPGVVVRLRYLTITGLNTVGGTPGINYQNGTAVHVEHCKVTGFDNSGILMNTPGRLYVSDSVFRNNTDGIAITANAGTAGIITIERTLIEQNSSDGISAEGGKTTIRKSRLGGNGTGIFGAGTLEVTMDDCNISHNGIAIFSNFSSIVRVANSTIANNGTAFSTSGGGQILSRSPASNTVEGNTTTNTFTGSYPAQ